MPGVFHFILSNYQQGALDLHLELVRERDGEEPVEGLLGGAAGEVDVAPGEQPGRDVGEHVGVGRGARQQGEVLQVQAVVGRHVVPE